MAVYTSLALTLEECIQLTLRIIHVQLLAVGVSNAIFRVLILFRCTLVFIEIFDLIIWFYVFNQILFKFIFGYFFVGIRINFGTSKLFWGFLRHFFGHCYLFLQLFKLLVLLLLFLLFISIPLFGCFDVDLEWIFEVIGEIYVCSDVLAILLLGWNLRFEIVEEQMTLWEFDMLVKSLGKAITYLFKI